MHMLFANLSTPALQISSWDFDVVEVDRLSGRRPLRTVLMHILDLEGLLVRPASLPSCQGRNALARAAAPDRWPAPCRVDAVRG